MTTSSDSPEIELLHHAFDVLSRGDFAVLDQALAEDAKWRTVEEGGTNCEGRNTILEIMSRNSRAACAAASRRRSRPARACSSPFAPSGHPTLRIGRWTTGSPTWS